MAGLLESAMTIFGHGMAGVGKAAGENATDRMKAKALKLRDENLARLQEQTATKLQTSQQRFTTGEREAATVTRRAETAEKRKYDTQTTSLATTTAQEAADTDYARKVQLINLETGIYADKAAVLWDKQTAQRKEERIQAFNLDEIKYQRRLDETRWEFQEQFTKSKELAELNARLANDAKTPTEKLYLFLRDQGKMKGDDAMAAVLSSLEIKGDTLDLKRRTAWMSAFNARLRAEGTLESPSNETLEKISAEVTARLGFSPTGTGAGGEKKITFDELEAAFKNRTTTKKETVEPGLLAPQEVTVPEARVPPPKSTLGFELPKVTDEEERTFNRMNRRHGTFETQGLLK